MNLGEGASCGRGRPPYGPYPLPQSPKQVAQAFQPVLECRAGTARLLFHYKSLYFY